MAQKGVMTKKELRDWYGFSQSTFHRLFNVKYLERFQALGYTKDCMKIPPIVLNEFIALYGEP